MRPLLVLLALLALAAPARAAGPELGIADDRMLLAGGPDADQAVAAWKGLGIQQVRIYALWSRIAGPTRSAPDNWAGLDAAVDRVVAAGMAPLLTITGPGPLWTSRSPRHHDPRFEPNPRDYAAFASAVATRYRGRVHRYVLWNEPNLGSWLRPQASCRRSGCTPVAPHLYRALVRAAYRAIHAADPTAQVLIGAMSSRGGDLHSQNSTERPLVFLRALGCVDGRLRNVRTGLCKGFKPAEGDGFAFHPHGVLLAPDRPFPNRDDVNIGSLGRLVRTLDTIQRHGGLRASTGRFGIYIDEYGYQTNPPDRLAGVPLATQSAWLQLGAYEAWRNPRVKLFTQYQWRDEPPNATGIFGGWQSGLLFVDGRPKPALTTFPLPFVLDAAHNRLWGQVRRRDAPTVTVERRPRGSAQWQAVATRATDPNGYWSWSTRLQKGAAYRYVAGTAASETLTRR